MSKGGILKIGKRHSKGGIPMKVKQTGQPVELEVDEGIINRRSMLSKETVTLDGKELSLCEAASEINQVEGGVSFACDPPGNPGKKNADFAENGGEIHQAAQLKFTTRTINNKLQQLSRLLNSERQGLNANEQQFVQDITRSIIAGEPFHKTRLEKQADALGIRPQNYVKELAELAIVSSARDIVQKGQDHEKTFQEIVSLYENQPNLSHRTSESIALQQYSTSAPIAYLMGVYVQSTYSKFKVGDKVSWIAAAGKPVTGFLRAPSNIVDGIQVWLTDKGYVTEDQITTDGKKQSTPIKYFEPSAGNGMLTIALPASQVVVNEIDDIRRRNLETQNFYAVLSQDATQAFTSFVKYFQGVLTNPPFGALDYPVYVDGYEISSLEHQMAINALATMKDDGSAALIIGGHNEYDKEGRITKGKNRIFMSYLFSHYQVKDVINIDGKKLYSKMGTGFNLRLILIDGRKTLPNGFPPLNDTTLEADETFSAKGVGSFRDLYVRISLLKTLKMQHGGQAQSGKENSRELQTAKEFGKIIGIQINERGNVLIDGNERDMLEAMSDLRKQIEEYADNDIDNADFTIEMFELDGSKIKDKKSFGRNVQTYLLTRLKMEHGGCVPCASDTN